MTRPVPMPRFKPQYHASITEQANDGVLDGDQLNVVVSANVAVDLNQFDSCLHFDNCAFDCSVEAINRRWALIDEQSDRFGPVALNAFGGLLHTTQDFYSHSNWVELHVDQDPIPVWDQIVANLPTDIVSGTFPLDWPKKCGPGAPTHGELNKDDPSSKEGQKIVDSGPNKGSSLFTLAFDAATAASRVQFKRLASGSSSPAIRSSSPLPTGLELSQLIELAVAVGDRSAIEGG